MQFAPISSRILHRLNQHRMRKEFPILNHQIDASDVHMHDPSRAHIQVANLAIPHLPLGESHKWPAGVNQRVRILQQQPVISRLASQRNGVSLGFNAVSPAVEDDKNERFWTRHKNAFSSWLSGFREKIHHRGKNE